MKAYFIGGLGCNPFYPKDFLEALPFPVTYLDLYQEEIRNLEELEAWFDKETTSENLLLLAHSLGGDFAVYLTNHRTNVQQLILLDGGYLQMDLICSLEEDLQAAEDYLATYRFATLEEAVEVEKSETAVWTANLEQAVRAGLVWEEVSQSYISNLSVENVHHLLSLRRKVQGEIQHLQQETLLLIPKQSETSPRWISQSLNDLPATVTLKEIAQTSHNLYQDQPEAVVKAIQDFLV